jgi:hypothetical protein
MYEREREKDGVGDMKEGWRWRVANVTDRIQCIFSVGLFWSQTSPISVELPVYSIGI